LYPERLSVNLLKKLDWLDREDWFLVPESELEKIVENIDNTWIKHLWTIKRKSSKPDYRFRFNEKCCIRCPVPILKYSRVGNA